MKSSPLRVFIGPLNLCRSFTGILKISMKKFGALNCCFLGFFSEFSGFELATFRPLHMLKCLIVHQVELQWLEHWWRVYHGCFKLVLESLGKTSSHADFGYLGWLFFLILNMVYYVYSLKSPRWGDSDDNIQYTNMLKKTEKISFLRLLSRRCD